MYELFLETKAARQIEKYAEGNLDHAEVVKQQCYENMKAQASEYGRGNNPKEFDDWWVNECLKDDRHKSIDVNSAFTWKDTPQGQNFWQAIDRVG